MFLSYFASAMAQFGTPKEIVSVVAFLEYAMLTIDICLFALFLAGTTLAAARDLWSSEWKA